MLLKSIDTISATQMAGVDRLMVEDFHIELSQMMENAGRHMATLAYSRLKPDFLDKVSKPVICIFVGPGHNGGGGLTAARYLSNWGVSVAVILMQPAENLRPEPKTRWQTLRRLPVKTAVWGDPEIPALLTSCRLMIDAMLGYNQRGNPHGPINEAIYRINAASVPVVALDIPSGLDATSGTPGEPCIRADATLTLALPKTGLVSQPGRRYSGDLYLADIGIPPVLYTHLGLPEQRLFKDNPILKLS